MSSDDLGPNEEGLRKKSGKKYHVLYLVLKIVTPTQSSLPTKCVGEIFSNYRDPRRQKVHYLLNCLIQFMKHEETKSTSNPSPPWI